MFCLRLKVADLMFLQMPKYSSVFFDLCTSVSSLLRKRHQWPPPRSGWALLLKTCLSPDWKYYLCTYSHCFAANKSVWQYSPIIWKSEFCNSPNKHFFRLHKYGSLFNFVLISEGDNAQCLFNLQTRALKTLEKGVHRGSPWFVWEHIFER